MNAPATAVPGQESTVRSSAGLSLTCRTFGTGAAVTIGLHGGPGGGDYLGLLHGLAGPDRRVVTFDQLGCGRSVPVPADHPWSMAEAVADVDAVRAATGAEQIDLIGHSWGGMLALEYALTHPARTRALVLWSTVPSVSRMVAGFRRQLATELSDEDLAGALTADALGRHDDPAFLRALSAWIGAYMTPDADEHADLVAEILQPDAAARGLWGSRLWLCDGALRGWDAEPRLVGVTSRTLVVHGEHDSSDRAANRVMADNIPGSRWITLPDESHMISAHGSGPLLGLFADFLDDTDERTAR